jgi:rhodanese-related sulfurtransferase
MSPTLSPSELKKLLDSKSVTLLDVRRKADYEAAPDLIPATLTGQQVNARFVEGGLKAWKEAGGELE